MSSCLIVLFNVNVLSFSLNKDVLSVHCVMLNVAF